MAAQKVTEIGFVGLGQMGKHIAKNLMGEDVELTVCDISQDQFVSFREAGAKTTTSVQDLAGCDIIFLCLPEDEAVKAVLTGEKGLLPLFIQGQTVVDLSTITYTTTVELAASLAAKGVVFLDAPVSGMESRAKEATLSVMVGGSAKDLARIEPYLRRIGNKILHMGPTGSGQLTKLINQLLFDINMAALAEVLPLAVKKGLDPEKVGQIVNSGTGRSYASEFFIPQILKNDFSAGYPMRNAYKDIISGALIAAKEVVPMPVTMAAATTYQTALLKGYGQEDKGAMIKVYEELLGVTYRR
ncbi:MAG: NAD(P)-dependent oxidoreductase [Deltaproteobacteria bacterium]|jgi:3-hydroxyisobutyrate dehydrogenase-like beta-hydroxyacid dehydrogenase|nr:NAD(P)-dependent oxidoreductase [Deltaproteobacteria bacterium]